MALAAIMERLTRRSPVTVMVRQTLQHAVSSQWIDELFEEQREKQYRRELLFSTVVDLMGLVALRLRPSRHAAAQSDPDLPVSLAALYGKIEGMFGELEAVLESEVRSLGRPRAALLAFGVAVLAYNVLSVVKSAVEASHDLEATNMQVSTYYIAAEVKFAYGDVATARVLKGEEIP